MNLPGSADIPAGVSFSGPLADKDAGAPSACSSGVQRTPYLVDAILPPEGSRGEILPERLSSFLFRPFGRQRTDLDFDFRSHDRPRLVTEVLTACLSDDHGSPLAASRVWSLPTSRRIASLLGLAAASESSVRRVTGRCPEEDCLQRIEFDLPIEEMLALQRRAEERAWLDWENGEFSLRLRRPTGCDQREWRACSFTNPLEARSAMLRSLVVEPEASPDAARGEDRPWEETPGLAETLEGCLDEFDPLVGFSVRTFCPHCGVETDQALDLETLALSALERIQEQRLRDIHRLASRYHWSESEILGLSPERRARYLQWIQEGRS